jgi:hypothetical protein
MSAKSRSIVKRTRASARLTLATLVSSARQAARRKRCRTPSHAANRVGHLVRMLSSSFAGIQHYAGSGRTRSFANSAAYANAALARASWPDAESRFVENPKASLDVLSPKEPAERCGDLTHAGKCLFAQSNHYDASGGNRRMLNNVCESSIERDQHAAFAACDSQHVFVGSTGQLLVASESHVVPRVAENRAQRVWDILIELQERHAYAAGKGTIVSRASSAA